MGEKHQWTNEQLKCLLDMCIEEVTRVGRKGLSLHKESWNKLGNVLQERFGLELSKKKIEKCLRQSKSQVCRMGLFEKQNGKHLQFSNKHFYLNERGVGRI